LFVLVDRVALRLGLGAQKRQELVEVPAGLNLAGLHALDPPNETALLQRSGNQSEDERGEHGRNVRAVRLTTVARAYHP